MELIRSERDTFRLTIRGHALIDEGLDSLLADAFVDKKIPGFLKGPTFKRKLELGLALGLIPPSLKEPIDRLSALRDKMAHGRISEVSRTQALEVFASVTAVVPSLEEIRESDDSMEPRYFLSLAIFVIWSALANAEQAARERREAIDAALSRAELSPIAVAILQQQLDDARAGKAAEG